MYFVCLCVDGCVGCGTLLCLCVCEGVGRDMHVPGVAPVKHFMKDLFLGYKDIHEGVFKGKKGTEIAEIAHEIAQGISKQKLELGSSAVSAEVSQALKEVQSARGSKRIASARLNLATSNDERESKRRVQL